MRARRAWPLARQLFPGARLSALGGTLYLAALGLLVMLGRIPDEDARALYLRCAALVAAGWWLLLGSRLCALVYHMAALRLPGIWPTLGRGVLLHLASSMLPALLILGWWLPAGVELAALLAALCLGAGAGMLIVSMPMAIPIVPLVIMLGDWGVVASPVFCALVGSFALGLSALAWHWQLVRARSPLLAPFGVELGGSPLQLLRLVREQPWSQARKRASHPSAVSPGLGPDLLAALLGPSCQTLRQVYGRRGQWLSYLVFLGGTLALVVGAAWWLPEDESGGVFFAAMMAAGLPMVMMKPAARLMALRRSQGAGLAELLLTPGMPATAQLPGALLRQILRCLGERLALLACTFAALATLTYAIRAEWLLWWAALACVMLLLGGATAWLAWHGENLSWWWSGTLGLGVMLTIATNVHMLAHARPLDERWWMSWAGWLLLSVLVFWRLQGRGALRRL